jgi:hypothetical protein
VIKDELKGDYIKGLPSKLSEFSKYLGDNNWLAGENVRDFKTIYFIFFHKFCFFLDFVR